MIQAPAVSITADPLPGNPFQSGSTNRYTYALDNPITFEDVSGLKSARMVSAGGGEPFSFAMDGFFASKLISDLDSVLNIINISDALSFLGSGISIILAALAAKFGSEVLGAAFIALLLGWLGITLTVSQVVWAFIIVAIIALIVAILLWWMSNSLQNLRNMLSDLDADEANRDKPAVTTATPFSISVQTSKGTKQEAFDPLSYLYLRYWYASAR